MNKKELEEKIKQIEEKINAIGDIQTKSNEIENIRNKVEEDKNLVEQSKNFAEETKPLLEEARNTSASYQSTIETQRSNFEQLKSEFEALLKENKDLKETIKNQLGWVSNKILASSFDEESEKLKESITYWFKWHLGSVIALFVVTVGVVAFEFLTTEHFLSANFLIKLSITAPIVYLLIFTAKQYGREKRMLDEYIYKAAIAKSFEAYRKIIKEEDTENTYREKCLDFIISTINQIYSSPMENVYKLKESDEVEIGVLGKLADIFKKFIEK